MERLETDRLTLRRPDADDGGDAEFMLRLLNEPSFLEHIGDRGVRTLEQARAYIQERMVASFERFGFGMWMAVRKEDEAVAGLCGLVKRDELEDVDLGFAFLPEHWSRGYATEAARAVMAHAKEAHGLTRLVAIVAPGNQPSIRLLRKLGFGFERKVRMAGEGEEIELYQVNLLLWPNAP